MTKSPTLRLLLGLLVTLAAVTIFSFYSLHELSTLRTLQTGTIDVNQHDSLLLLKVQDDVNVIGLRLRDMTQEPSVARIADYRGQFARLRDDLESTIRADTSLRTARHRKERADLERLLRQFWETSDKVFQNASSGAEARARSLVSGDLSAQQALLATEVSYLVQRNTQAEQLADREAGSIYKGVERDIYAFLAATIVAIVVTSSYVIYSNRQFFQKLEFLSRQRRVLAAKLITVQEEVLRSVSRELHDEFGQILTAVSAMLARAERKGVPPDSPLRTELKEVREITHNTLERMRSLSQMLHPAILDDYGLAKGIEWYTEVFQRQTGIETTAAISGTPVRVTGRPAIHCFRIVQEALNNCAKHSGTKRAEVEMFFDRDQLTVNIRDFGKGIATSKRNDKPGLGLIAMRERAELLCGTFSISSAPNAGTTVSLSMPIHQEECAPEAFEEQRIGEVVIRKA
jgi:signal transduction histidine kinase